MKGILLIMGALALTGCSAHYKSTDVKTSTEKLKQDMPVSIAVPKDGFYSTTVYHGSGQETASALQAAFVRYSEKVSITNTCGDVECLSKATTTEGYLVVPQILHWEDRATEWSMKRDKLEVKISVYKASNLTLINSTILNGESKLATWGGDHPQDLLAEPINSYVSQLY
ncbi:MULTISPECIES: DUF4823 domain-containing protein [unclassified Pantoea]|uniref:DUF4823 domain-containing protein n=1 Tax=unclassified Pantoea TaxID=2630326 RepID=UPI001CD5AE3F|nr:MULTISPECIES: DUF4823 domain-containing protein [unclassified Pantoea]MCA1176178.1 DUF4823 domain-containing protein [Pantoea sp. alder69]MCA1249148.1 DUF4823 domain-containing protein [Pantoea sp. alder70]MCA1264777.1 DUF4823 domain-containing protein [Pantoea sp. alder81]